MDPPKDPASLQEELKQAQAQILHERRRADGLASDLKLAKEQYVLLQTQLEHEEEAITNKLIKRLDQLKREKAEMEAEEELLNSTLERRLEQASKEQAAIVNKLQKQLEQLKCEKTKLFDEKIALENDLEAEQEFIMNKLQKQVEKTRQEKASLAVEKSDLARHVMDLVQSMEKIKRDKVLLEQEMEMEEENITNRLQRQVDMLLVSLRQVDSKLQSQGSSLAELGVSLPAMDIPGASLRIARLSSGAAGGCSLARTSLSSMPSGGPLTSPGRPITLIHRGSSSGLPGQLPQGMRSSSGDSGSCINAASPPTSGRGIDRQQPTSTPRVPS